MQSRSQFLAVERSYSLPLLSLLLGCLRVFADRSPVEWLSLHMPHLQAV